MLNEFDSVLLFILSLQDEIFQKFNLDTEWAVRLISRITNDEDIAIESNVVVKQVRFVFYYNAIFKHRMVSGTIVIILLTFIESSKCSF
jgi:hypothetical protein